MKQLYYFKWPLALLLTGILVRSFGARLKIMHWPAGDTTLVIASILIGVAVVWLITRLVLLNSNK